MSLSLAFILFLAVLLPLYFLAPRRAQWLVLLVGSIVFYAFSGWQNLCVLIFLTIITYAFGRLLGRSLDRQNAVLEEHRADGSWDKPTRKAFRDRCVARRKWLLATSIVLALLPLAVFKYDDPVMRAVNALAGASYDSPLILSLPGISYVTLSAIGYLVDVSRGQQACEKNPLRFALFTFYFPQIWQGPINRYGELAPQLFASHSFDARRALEGGIRALWGGVKKVVVANTTGIAVRSAMEQLEPGGTWTWLMILLYSIQIYADFTGGMDIVMGVSHMLDIDLYENFDRPFGACSVADYWRRWHRSMGRFFTDYVFYPLSVSRFSQKLSRLSRRLPLWIATLLTWSLTGLWHGAGMNFVLWGLCNGLFILISQELRPLRRKLSEHFPRAAGSRLLSALCCGGTLFTVGLFRTLDLFGLPGITLSRWQGALAPSAVARLFDASLWTSLGLSLPEWILIGLGVIAMWLVGRATPRVSDTQGETLGARIASRPVTCAVVCALMIVIIAVFGHYGLGYDAMDFIYGQY
ncbi:MAG: MBOAT family protein [Clostridia bacterium]|nr:MBOAT family protein [Clostridia bacterium]